MISLGFEMVCVGLWCFVVCFVVVCVGLWCFVVFSATLSSSIAKLSKGEPACNHLTTCLSCFLLGQTQTHLLSCRSKLENRKVPKFSDARKFCCNLPKI